MPEDQSHHNLDTLLSSDTDEVVREGKIFEVGDYPERDFCLSEAEMQHAVRDFEPLPIKLQHVDTPLDGKLGMLESLRVAGSTLLGRARLPCWLDRLVPDKRVSCGWDRATKRLTELSLVTEPRITDAVLYAAGAAHKNPGADNQQSRLDAVPTKPTEEMIEPMNVKEWLSRMRALFSTMPSADSDDLLEPDTQVDGAALRAELEELRARQRMADAAAFADTEIRARRAFPSERNPLIAAFMQAASDDERIPATATFSDEPQASRVDALRALQAARTPHPLTEELLDPSRSAKALFHEQKTGAEIDSDARRTELLSQTRLGRDILKTEKGK